MDTYIINATRQCNACVVEQEREGKQSVGGEKKSSTKEWYPESLNNLTILLEINQYKVCANTDNMVFIIYKNK